ncbi:uncharacterized protein LOC111065630 [Drosophila obscura]|uniref:uncharacterized protein LOC111065630 n=1 Tax=Drosophila obscura TaxID=7282 RepID=UPI001BB1ABA3|nr:uncharacterized protein LOC111065630 [Drosophila obscura]
MSSSFIVLAKCIVFLYLVRGIATKVEYTNINCTSLDKDFCDFEYCFLKSVNRSYKYMSLKVNLFKIPVTNVKVNFSLLKRFSGYKPFLYNITVDACKVLRYPKSNPVFVWFHGLFSKHSNMNHTCPFEHDLVVNKLSGNYVNTQFSEVLPFPDGEYLFQSNWYAYNVNRAVVNVYITLASEFLKN